jgi:hypothetical protein
MYNTDLTPAFKVEYIIRIQDLVELLTKEDPRITHDLIWEEFRYDWGGQDSYYKVDIDNFIDRLYDYFWYPEGDEVEPEDSDAFVSKPITDDMEPREVLYRIVIKKMADGFIPDKFLILISW